MVNVIAFDWGAPLTPDGPAAMYVAGRSGDDTGLFRSTVPGEWEHIAIAPGDLYDGLEVVAGDPFIPGRVYVGFGGASIVQGDDPLLGS